MGLSPVLIVPIIFQKFFHEVILDPGKIFQCFPDFCCIVFRHPRIYGFRQTIQVDSDVPHLDPEVLEKLYLFRGNRGLNLRLEDEDPGKFADREPIGWKILSRIPYR